MQAKPIETRQILPAEDRTPTGQNPTEIRYGWCPYGDISLGGPALYAQPHQIDVDGQVMDNPYHWILPIRQLIPFPTFPATEQMPSPDQRDSNGRAILISSVRTMTALDAILSVLNRYSMWGFTILRSLQGVDQDTAFRIFQVVQPLDYPMSQLVGELSFGAQERIEAAAPITFKDAPGYSVESLRSDMERDIALRLSQEMLVGAEIAFTLANEELGDTVTSMTKALSGGHGKTSPDPRDKRLCAELDRTLPKAVEIGATETDSKIDFLVNRAVGEDKDREIERLKAELAAAVYTAVPITEVLTPCGAIRSNGEPCGIRTKGDAKCGLHSNEV